MCNNIYSAKFARVLMKANNKKSGLLYNHRVTDILLCNHLATVSYQSTTGPTVDLNSFAKIQAKAKPSDLQERRRDSASTRPSASLATNSRQIHAISSILSSSQRALSEITDSHTRVKKPVPQSLDIRSEKKIHEHASRLKSLDDGKAVTSPQNGTGNQHADCQNMQQLQTLIVNAAD